MKCKKCGAVFGRMIGITLCLPNGYSVTDKFRAVAPCGHWVKWFPPEDLEQRGEEVSRKAHNLEIVGSSPTAAMANASQS